MNNWNSINILISGSGKTFTMQPLPLRAAEDLVRLLHQPFYRNQKFKLWLSYFEIYGGKLFDLLSDRKLVFLVVFGFSFIYYYYYFGFGLRTLLYLIWYIVVIGGLQNHVYIYFHGEYLLMQSLFSKINCFTLVCLFSCKSWRCIIWLMWFCVFVCGGFIFFDSFYLVFVTIMLQCCEDSVLRAPTSNMCPCSLTTHFLCMNWYSSVCCKDQYLQLWNVWIRMVNDFECHSEYLQA